MNPMIAKQAQRAANPKGSRSNGVISLVMEILGFLAQLALIVAGIRYIVLEDDDLSEHARLFTWCLVATLYLLATVIWLNIDLRVHDSDHQFMKRVSHNPLVVLFTTIVAFSSSAVGLSAAITLIMGRGDPDYFTIFELVAVWAMLASWAMFHWGYARSYHALYHKHEADRPLRFPGTEQPRLIDFVYFSFTNGTSFAPSDVTIQTSRMRWTVVWHTTFSFFFNALIIVLTMSTISGGFATL